ncbi:hypothetical protein GpartN1_g2820.t1 [Galdieria partita]|uniref:5'-3' DNA helicase ZGRF1-like N-terminal domain-containing protein n=1 Tax=Galdieria partita TaxID=83374 RepID=A0A9C7PU59_9RHOD|nr:hypothetical protein GpartN1_g2326.t1 [Galdieria partita]GJQ11029.1 hypothetical protein GpartN1_g2820.t1 [Galdieria partita]
MTSFEALYTKQKTQKHKKWKDGSLQVEYKERTTPCKTRVRLFDEDGLLLLTATLNSKSIVPGDNLEIEQYLVQILEPNDTEVFPSQQHKELEDADIILEAEQNHCKKRKRISTDIRFEPPNSALVVIDNDIKTQVNYSGRTVDEIIRLLSE